jgi:anti-sigma factor RsiW
MLCKNNDIKDLLPAYVADALEEADLARVKEHLLACADCAQETALLRMLADGPVPDPGEAFWAELPGRVYRAVRQKEKEARRPRLDLHELLQRMAFPRWAWAAAAVGIVFTVSLLVMHQAPQETAAPALPGDEYASEDGSHQDPVLRHTSVTIAELTSRELDAVDAWAATELSALALEAGANAANIFDTDLNEELAELDAREADRLSTMLTEQNEEG